MALRKSVGRVLPESEQIDAHACVLKKLFTGIGQCTCRQGQQIESVFETPQD